MSIAVPSTSEDNNNGVEIYSTGREYIRDASCGDNEQLKEEEGEGGEEVEGGLSTPPPGLGGREVTRVLDTPHVHDKQKSKFSDGRSLLEETQEEEESIYAGFEPTPCETARRLFDDHGEENRPGVGEHMVLDDDVTGDEDEDVIPTMPADPATLPTSDTSGVSAPVSFIGTLPPSSGDVGMRSPSEGESLITKVTPPREGREGEQEEELPDSLPEAFKVAQEIKRLGYTPPGLKTYGHRRGPPGHGRKQGKVAVEKMGEGEESGQEPWLTPMPKSSPLPKSGVQGNRDVKVQGNGKGKGKAPEREIKESSQPIEEQKAQEISGESIDIDEKEKEEVSPATGRRPRLKRPRKEATTATPGKRKRRWGGEVEEVAGSDDEDEARLEEEVGAEEIVEVVIEQVKSAKRKTTRQKEREKEDKKKENNKPPKKKARTTSGKAEKEDKGMNTQYTFHGSDEEANEEGSENVKEDSPPAVKTPAKRGRKSIAIGNAINTPAKPHALPASTSTSPNHAPKTTSPYSGPTPKIVFSNSAFPDRKDATSILRALSVKKAQKVTEKGVTHLVVGSGGLVRSR